MEIKTDCFAWNPKQNECDILDCVICKERECSFYKTKDRLKNDRVEAKKKIQNEMAKVFIYKDDIWRFKEV